MKKKRITKTISILFWSIIISCFMIVQNNLSAQESTPIENNTTEENDHPTKYIFFIDLFNVNNY